MKATSAEKILLEFDPKAENLLPALKKISEAFGYVSEKEAQKIASYFSLTLMQVFETASFYDLVNVKKQPALSIKVCSGTNCTYDGCRKVIKEIENFFRIKEGDEFNPKVKLETMSCLGRCGEGPIVIINGNVYTKVTTSGVDDILKSYT
jgi:NADH:ubiquinone oxidoreductase subunit E